MKHTDWKSWHDDYDDPDSPMSRRLRFVQRHIREALDEAPPGPIRVISVCAGQGRDLLEVLATHPRRDDVAARLVELDPRNVEHARGLARDLPQVEIREGDAALTDNYAGLAPAQILLLCGIFGNIENQDIQRTVSASPQLCTEGGITIWTRHRDAPDLFPTVCGWFEEQGFERLHESDPEERWGVGVHRLRTPSRPLQQGQHLFTFHGYRALRG